MASRNSAVCPSPIPKFRSLPQTLRSETMSQPRELALGLDLSTQQLKVVAVDLSNLETFYEKSVTFETDLKHFNTTKGVYVQGDEVYSPVEMWIEALDIILGKMRDEAFSFNRVVVISGAGQVPTATCERG